MGAGRLALVAAALCLGTAAGVAGAADLTSHLGNAGPGFAGGLTPSKLGWGADDRAYPDRFVVNPPDLAEMVWVPAGTFRMGSTQQEIDTQWTENGWDPTWRNGMWREQPAHEVTLADGFWLGRHEVTVDQYERFLDATSGEVPPFWSHLRSHERLPVIMVTWTDSEAYAKWAGGTLPTEAQWEWSARGPEARVYPWGNRWDRTKCNSAEHWAAKALNTQDAWLAWTAMLPATFDGLLSYMREVGSCGEDRGWAGVLDQAGNVSEWCSDWYGESHDGAGAVTDPLGPVTGSTRVCRGGCWSRGAVFCRSSFRAGDNPSLRIVDLGLRVARPPRP